MSKKVYGLWLSASRVTKLEEMTPFCCKFVVSSRSRSVGEKSDFYHDRPLSLGFVSPEPMLQIIFRLRKATVNMLNMSDEQLSPHEIVLNTPGFTLESH